MVVRGHRSAGRAIPDCATCLIYDGRDRNRQASLCWSCRTGGRKHEANATRVKARPRRDTFPECVRGGRPPPRSRRGLIAAGFGSGFHPALDSRPTTPSITARRNRRGPNLGLALNFGLRFRHRRTRVPTLRSAQGIGGSVIGDRPIDGGRQWSVRTTGQWAEVTFNDGGFQPLAVATLEVESQASLRATISDCPGRRPPCMH